MKKFIFITIMGNKNTQPSQSDYLLIDTDKHYPENVIPVHVWKIRCLTENKDIFYVNEQCPQYCPYGRTHEIDMIITRMKPHDLIMDKYRKNIFWS